MWVDFVERPSAASLAESAPLFQRIGWSVPGSDLDVIGVERGRGMLVPGHDLGLLRASHHRLDRVELAR